MAQGACSRDCECFYNVSTKISKIGIFCDLFVPAHALRFECCYWRTHNRFVSVFGDLNFDKTCCSLDS
jgi:hypothetical protein